MTGYPEIFLPKDQGHVFPVLGWDDGEVQEVAPLTTATAVVGGLQPLGVYMVTFFPATGSGYVRVIPAFGADPAAGDYDTAMSWLTLWGPLMIKLLEGQDRIGFRNNTGATTEITVVRLK